MASLLGALRASMSLDSANFTRGAKRVRRDTSTLEKNLGMLQRRMFDVSRSIRGIAVAAAATGGALTAFAATQTSNIRNLDSLARAAGLSRQELQALGIASRSVGVDADGLGNILRDVSDRIGDFVSTGGGAFQDVADALNLSALEARRFARELDATGNASVALQTIYNRLQEAGVSGSQLTFVLESLSSEASRLSPLLADNGREFQRLADRAVRSGAIATDSQEKALKQITISWEDLQDAVVGVGNNINEVFAPAVSNVLDLLTKTTIAAGNLVERMNRLGGVFGAFNLGNSLVNFSTAIVIFGAAIGGITTALGFLFGLLGKITRQVINFKKLTTTLFFPFAGLGPSIDKARISYEIIENQRLFDKKTAKRARRQISEVKEDIKLRQQLSFMGRLRSLSAGILTILGSTRAMWLS